MLADWNITNFENDGGQWAVTREREPRASLHREYKPLRLRSLVWVVREGQTLSLISDRTGVPVSRIARDNDIKDVDVIHVGQRLVVNLNG